MQSKKEIESNLSKLFWMNICLSIFALVPVMTLFYLHRGLSYPQIFLMGVAFGVGTLVFEVPTGIIADKVGRKIAMLLGIGTYIIHYTIYLFAQGFLQIVLGFLVFMIGLTFLSGSIEAFFYDSLKFCKRERDMKREFGKYVSASRIPSFFIPFLGAWIAKDLLEWQFQALLGISLIFTIAAFIIVLTLKESKHHYKAGPKSSELLRESVALFRKNKDFRRIFFNSFLVAVPFWIFWRIWQPYITGIGAPVILLGVIVATHNMGSFFLERSMHKFEERFGMAPVIFLTALIPFIGYLLLIASKGIGLALLGIYLVFLFSLSRRPLISDYLNSHIPSKHRATALSLLNMLSGLSQIFLFLVISYLTIYSQFIGLYVAAGLALVGLIFFRLSDDHVAKERA